MARVNEARQLAEKICRSLRDGGHQAYLVGGCVRDILLGRQPADFDVATDAQPDRVQQLFPHSLAVGARFGVIIVRDDDREGDSPQVEVATFRSDVGYSDGRHPDHVVYTSSAEEDVKRRDFTINALLLDPATDLVLDFVSGREDLEAGIIRAIGRAEDRFHEDKLRMIRAVRFAARFGYRIEAQTFAAVSKLAGDIHQVSPERLRDELTKLLTEGAASRAFELLDETGLLPQLLPEVAAMKGVQQPPQFHPEGDVWIHTLRMIGQLSAGASPTLAWGVLLHDVGKPPTFTPPSGPEGRIRFDEHAEIGAKMAEQICRRFRFSNHEASQVAALVSNHMRFKDVLQMKPATLKRFVRLGSFDEHLELHRLDCSSSHGHLENYEFVRQYLRVTPPEQVRPPRLISGNDLIALGLRPSPSFKTLLDAVEEAQLNGGLETREQALDLVKDLTREQ
ncbi:MAG: CCA tRNA nucleotidyltransferase [Acidobacteriota bacterium]|nr:CCA tRNA nucleotidyltransferase [Acidobacteriota bacterium]